MKVAFFSAAVALWLLVSSSTPAEAAAPPSRAPHGAPPASTVHLPLAACVFNASLVVSCPFDKPYSAEGLKRNGRLFRTAPLASMERTRFAREFDEAFTDPLRLMERCRKQKPAGRLHRNEVAWYWKQSLQEYPLPADPNENILLGSAQLTLSSYQYCMLRRRP